MSTFFYYSTLWILSICLVVHNFRKYREKFKSLIEKIETLDGTKIEQATNKGFNGHFFSLNVNPTRDVYKIWLDCIPYLRKCISSFLFSIILGILIGNAVILIFLEIVRRLSV